MHHVYEFALYIRKVDLCPTLQTVIIFPSVLVTEVLCQCNSLCQWPWKYPFHYFLESCICYLLYFLHLLDSLSLLTFYCFYFLWFFLHIWKPVQFSYFIKTLHDCSFTSTTISLDISLNFGSWNSIPPDAMFTNFQLTP